MFSTCSKLTPRAPIPDGRMEQIMQPWLKYFKLAHLWSSGIVDGLLRAPQMLETYKLIYTRREEGVEENKSYKSRIKGSHHQRIRTAGSFPRILLYHRYFGNKVLVQNSNLPALNQNLHLFFSAACLYQVLDNIYLNRSVCYFSLAQSAAPSTSLIFHCCSLC